MDILWVLLILFLVGGIGSTPNWGWHHFGYAPSGGLFLVAIIVLVIILVQRR